MATLVTPADVKALVHTSLSDANVQKVIDRVEAQINEKIGAPWSGDDAPVEFVKTLRGEGTCLFLPTDIHAVVSIVEDGVTLSADQYQVWGAGVIERLPIGSGWGNRVVVTYEPVDDRLKRTEVIINLVRLVIERTAMESENIAGEYSFTAPENWDAEFRKAMKKLQYKAI